MIDHEKHTLYIPIISNATNANNSSNFIEIFSNELPSIAPSTLLPILESEKASLKVYNACASLYSLYNVRHARQILEAASKVAETMDASDPNQQDELLRMNATMGILLVTLANLVEDKNEIDDLRASAEHYFTTATKLDTFYPVTWVGM